MNDTTSAVPVAPQAVDDDPVPEDIDEFRDALARKIARFIGDRKGYWRGCKEPACRRRRACVAPRIHCSNAPHRPANPERRARLMARLQRVAREISARQRAEK